MSEPGSRFRKALDLTESMLASARNQQWDEVAALEVERGRMLDSALDCSPAADELSDLHDLLHRILRLNNELLELGDKARRGLASSLKQLSHSRIATSAYSSNQA